MTPRDLTRGLRRLFRNGAVEQELSDEVAHYLEMAVDEHVRAGLSRAEAVRRARVEFGGVEAAKEGLRSAGWDGLIETLYRDLVYGGRALRRNPAFTLVAVLTLALGIGANTAMFSVVDAVMLRPLPYRDAGRLALIYTDDVRRGLHEEGSALRTIEDWRATNRSFQDIAFYHTQRSTLLDAGIRERTRSAFASANLFATLGVAPLRGRTFTAEDESSAEPLAVISHSLWQRRFAGDPAAIGKTLQTEDTGRGGTMMRIIGIMPPGFYFPDKLTEIWTPATTYWRFSRESGERFQSWARRWTAIGRLRPNTSIDDARRDLSGVGTRLAVAYPSDVPDFPGFATNVTPVLDHVAGRNLQSALWVLLGAVTLVLLVACANVANLLLARGASREREFAIRRALGAGRARLIRQLAVESMVLALAGGGLGVLLAAVGTRVLAAVGASRIPRIEEVTIDVRVLAFAALASVVAGAVFGVVPAFRVSAADASQALKEGGRSSGGVRVRRTRGALVVVECALAIVLLAAAGLLLRSLDQLRAVDPGFDPTGVLTMRIEYPPEAAPSAEERLQPNIGASRARNREQMMYELTQRVAAMPGIEAVGFVDDLFLSGQGNESITIPGRAPDSFGAGELNEATVSPGFFPAMHVPLRRGRYLTRDDAFTKIRALWAKSITTGTLAEREVSAIPEPVVVNDAFVRRFFPDEDPIGRRFCIDPTGKTYWYVIAGVVGDMHRQGLERRAIPEYFGAYFPSPTARGDLVVRVQGDPLAVAANVRQIVSRQIPGALISGASTADRGLGNFTAQRNFQTWLLAAFAVLALVLAAIGIYGVVHYAVAERTREIGVRIALGASPWDVTRLVVGQGMRTPVIGISLGLVGAVGLTRLMSHLLFGIGPRDPATLAGGVVILLTAAAVACLLPALRAVRIDPVIALRQE